ncbi:MAG: ATP-dependent protease ATPase subunit HslU [Phycisphaerae bacterium]
MTHLTPKQIVAELDRYIVGQADAKRAVAVAIRNRWRRRQLPEDVARDVAPKNIIMIGPTGVGKTEIARRLAGLTASPFIKVEATKFTEVGYFGRDVESIIRDLLDSSIALVKAEMAEGVKERAGEAVEDRLLDHLLPRPKGGFGLTGEDQSQERYERTRERFRQQLRDGELEGKEIEISVEQKASLAGMLGQQPGMQMDVEMESMLERMMPSKRQTRKLKVSEARQVLLGQEAEKLIDKEKITAEAISRVEQGGIVFLDELDKVAAPEQKQGGPDVSRQGVQRDLLPIVEGSTVVTKHGPVKTDHILFIAAGAFHSAKPSDLMPELQGRFPIRVELSDLTKADFIRILTEPKNALLEQQRQLLATEGLAVEVSQDAIEAMAQIAYDANRRSQNIGARRLYTILERVFEDLAYDSPDMGGDRVDIDATYVRSRLDTIMQDEDLSRFIL